MERPPSVAAIVLAAGASTRMGTPKALLVRGGTTFIRGLVDLSEASGCAPVIVVAGAIELPPEACGGAMIVENAAWPKGQLSSLQVGVRALAGLADAAVSGALVLTVDRPHLRRATVDALLAAHREDPAAILQPTRGGRRGHPILYPAAVFAGLLGLDAEAGPRAWLRSEEIARLRRGVELAAEDPAIFDNVDTPADLVRLRG